MSAKVSAAHSSSTTENASILQRLADTEAWMKSAGEKNKELEMRCAASESKVESLVKANKELREELDELRKGGLISVSGRLEGREKKRDHSKRLLALEDCERNPETNDQVKEDKDATSSGAELTYSKQAEDASVVATIGQTYVYAFGQFAVAATILLATCNAFPVTKWDDSSVGVPVVDEQVRVRSWFSVMGGCATLLAAFNTNSHWDSGICNEPWAAAWPALPICILSGSFAFSVAIGGSLGSLALGVDLSFYGNLTMIVFSIACVLYVAIAQVLMRKAYFEWWLGPDHSVREQHRREEEDLAQNTKRARQRRPSLIEQAFRKIKDSRTTSIVRTILVTTGLAVNAVLYPTLIIPFFNADTTSDSVRVIILTVVLSLISEGTLMVLRFAKIQVGKNFDPKVAVQVQNMLLLFEVFTIVTRRLLLGCMAVQRSVFAVG